MIAVLLAAALAADLRPVAAGALLVESDALTRLGPDGAVAWRAAVACPAPVDAGALLLCADGPRLTALAASTGKVRWRRDLGGPVRAAAAAAGRVVADLGAAWVWLDDKGRPRERIDAPGRLVAGCGVGGDAVLLASAEGAVAAVDPGTGAVRWRAAHTLRAPALSCVDARLVAGQDGLALASWSLDDGALALLAGEGRPDLHVAGEGLVGAGRDGLGRPILWRADAEGRAVWTTSGSVDGALVAHGLLVTRHGEAAEVRAWSDGRLLARATDLGGPVVPAGPAAVLRLDGERLAPVGLGPGEAPAVAPLARAPRPAWLAPGATLIYDLRSPGLRPRTLSIRLDAVDGDLRAHARVDGWEASAREVPAAAREGARRHVDRWDHLGARPERIEHTALTVSEAVIGALLAGEATPFVVVDAPGGEDNALSADGAGVRVVDVGGAAMAVPVARGRGDRVDGIWEIATFAELPLVVSVRRPDLELALRQVEPAR